jgi:hypothetical protein
MKNAKKIADSQPQRPRPLYSLHPWQCRHYPDRSDITAFVEASSQWETVAEI